MLSNANVVQAPLHGQPPPLSTYMMLFIGFFLQGGSHLCNCSLISKQKKDILNQVTSPRHTRERNANTEYVYDSFQPY